MRTSSWICISKRNYSLEHAPTDFHSAVRVTPPQSRHVYQTDDLPPTDAYGEGELRKAERPAARRLRRANLTGPRSALIFYQECRPLSERSSSTRAPVIFGDSLVSSQFPLSIVRTLLSISVCFREQTTLLSGFDLFRDQRSECPHSGHWHLDLL